MHMVGLPGNSKRRAAFRVEHVADIRPILTSPPIRGEGVQLKSGWRGRWKGSLVVFLRISWDPKQEGQVGQQCMPSPWHGPGLTHKLPHEGDDCLLIAP